MKDDGVFQYDPTLVPRAGATYQHRAATQTTCIVSHLLGISGHNQRVYYHVFMGRRKIGSADVPVHEFNRWYETEKPLSAWARDADAREKQQPVHPRSTPVEPLLRNVIED